MACVRESGFSVELRNGDASALRHVKQLLQNNTDWTFSGAEFELIPKAASVVFARDSRHKTIVGCAVLANPVADSTTYWLGLVIVMKRYRRMGVGTLMVNELLGRVLNGHVALMASLMGVALYESVGFEEVRNLSIGHWCVDVELERDEGETGSESDEEEEQTVQTVQTVSEHRHKWHTAAKKLYEKVAARRGFALDYMVRQCEGGRCIVHLSEDGRGVQAAAWMRRVQSAGGDGAEMWLGPMVGDGGSDGGDARLRRVLRRAVRWCAREAAVRRVCCLGANERLMRDARFRLLARVPLMAMRVHDARRVAGSLHAHSVQLRAAEPSAAQQYHALCDWYVG